MAENNQNKKGAVTIDFPSSPPIPPPEPSGSNAVVPPVPGVPPPQSGGIPGFTQDAQPSPQFVPGAFVDQTNNVPQETFSITPESGMVRRGGGIGGFFKKLFTVLFLLIFLAGLAFGGWYALKFFKGAPGGTVTYWGLWKNDSIITPVIQAFEAKNPNIKIDYVKQNHREYRERLTAAIDRGEGPDVFRFHNTWVPLMAKQLDNVPEEVINVSDFTSTFYPVAKSDLVAGTSIYGLPIEIDGLGLYINEDLFAAAGVSQPTTWEDIVKPGGLVEKLRVLNGTEVITSAIALGTTNNIEHYSDIMALLMLQNGVSLVSPTGIAAEEALQFFRKFADPNDPVYNWNDTLDNSVAAFANGRVAMILAPSWRAFDVRQINPDRKFRIVPVPQLPGTNVTWASYWVEGVSAKSSNKALAWKFVEFLTSKEGSQILYSEASKMRLFGEPFARVEMAVGVAGDPYVEAYLTQAPNARSFPLASRTWDNGLNDVFIKYLEDALNSYANGAAASEALETMSQGFSQTLNQYGLSTQTAQ